MKTYHTEFRFADPKLNHLHCTHKYFGELSPYEINYICHFIGDYFFSQEDEPLPVLTYDRVEFFGPMKLTRVLTYEDHGYFPLIYLKGYLDRFRVDEFSPPVTHITTPDLDKVICEFDRYVLVEIGNNLKTDLFTVYI